VSDFDVDKYEVELWEKELKRIDKEVAEAKRMMDNDPLTVILDCHMELKKLLDENQGAQKRTTPEFIAKVNQVAKREKKAKQMEKKGLNLVKLSDIYYDLKFKRDMIAQKYHTIEYRLRR